MEGLNTRANELANKLTEELEAIRKQAEEAAALPEKLTSLKDQAVTACREMETVATDLKEATKKFGTIMETLAKAQEAVKDVEGRIVAEIRESNRKTEEAKSEVQKAIKASEGKVIGVIVVGLLLLAVGMIWITTA